MKEEAKRKQMNQIEAKFEEQIAKLKTSQHSALIQFRLAKDAMNYISSAELEAHTRALQKAMNDVRFAERAHVVLAQSLVENVAVLFNISLHDASEICAAYNDKSLTALDDVYNKIDQHVKREART